MNPTAMHEAGHVLALAAAGIYSELTCVKLGAAEYTGQPVFGLTLRDGRSLLDFNQRLVAMATRVANGNATPAEYTEFMINNAVDCCFPHVCFFAGGYAIEKCFGGGDLRTDARATIDKRQIREAVLPAMGLAKVPGGMENVSEETFNRFWNWGVEIVKGAIVQNKDAALRLADNIARHGHDGVLYENAIDAFFAADAEKIACAADFKNDPLVRMAKEYYAVEFRKANPLFSNV